MKASVVILIYEDKEGAHYYYHTSFDDDITVGELSLLNLCLDEIKGDVVEMATNVQAEIEYIDTGDEE